MIARTTGQNRYGEITVRAPRWLTLAPEATVGIHLGERTGRPVVVIAGAGEDLETEMGDDEHVDVEPGAVINVSPESERYERLADFVVGELRRSGLI